MGPPPFFPKNLSGFCVIPRMRDAFTAHREASEDALGSVALLSPQATKYLANALVEEAGPAQAQLRPCTEARGGFTKLSGAFPGSRN